MNEYHTPVLAKETIELLDVKESGTYVDLTFGGGGHSRLILSELNSDGRLYGFDQDLDTRENIPEDERFTLVESNFRFFRGHLRQLEVTQVDGVLADLGVSSHHFDIPERGFSFRFDAPLDMRMNQRGNFTAAKLLNEYSSEKLIAVLRDWGEIQNPHRVAGEIIDSRRTAPIATISDLTKAVERCVPKHSENQFLAQLFQALRIEVNGEMEALKMALEQSLKVLKPGGRLVVISYHSLEDRLVKNFMRTGNFEGKVEKDFYGNPLTPWSVITRKVVTPSQQELEFNPRSRSAKLRGAEKLVEKDSETISTGNQ